MDIRPSIVIPAGAMPSALFVADRVSRSNMMKKLTSSLIAVLALTLGGCASTVLKVTDSPMAYQSTHLQYRILTEGLPESKSTAARPGLRWVSLGERTLAAATLPLSSVVETLFLPATYLYTGYINHLQADEYPLAPARTGMLSRSEPESVPVITPVITPVPESEPAAKP